MATQDPNNISPAETETVLEPELPICDAHHHLWAPPGIFLGLLRPYVASQRGFYSRVECATPTERRPGELRPVVDGFLRAWPIEFRRGAIKTRGAAIVGHANLTLGVKAGCLQGLAASPDRFRGIRHSTIWDASDALRSDAQQGLLTDSHFRRGFAWLGKLNLSFDAWLYHPQLPELAALAQAFPEVTIVLNHIAAPLGVGPYAGKRDEVFKVWSRGIAALAGCPNVLVKLGGVGSLRSGYDWQERAVKPSSAELATALGPYFEWCIENLGAERCMFESNFPVEKLATSYVNLWNSFKRITAKYSSSERAALFHDTAARAYRIK